MNCFEITRTVCKIRDFEVWIIFGGCLYFSHTYLFCSRVLNSFIPSRVCAIFMNFIFTTRPLSCRKIKFSVLSVCSRVATCDGNVREDKIFSRSGKSPGILKKCQEILAIWPKSESCQGILSCHVRELLGNFVVTFFLDWNFHHTISPPASDI